jgi:hypothetical protein
MKTLFRSCLIFFLALLGAGAASGQVSMAFKGEIKASTGAIVPYATISLNAPTAYGAISNDEGKFELHIDSTFLNDTIVITSVGYRNYVLPVRQAVARSFHTIVMQDTVHMLKEVFVSNRSPQELVADAISKIDENFYASQYEMDCFYRHTARENGVYNKMDEAALKVFDAGFNKPIEVKVDYTQVRKAVDQRTLKSHTTIAPVQMVNSFNLVHAQAAIKSFVTKDYWDFEIVETTYFNDKPVYVIKATVKDNVQRFVFDAVFYIVSGSGKIIRMDFDGERKIEKLDYSLSGKGAELYRYQVNDLKGTATYSERNGKLFLNYIQVRFNFGYSDKNTGKPISTFNENSELLVYNIRERYSSSPPKNNKSIDGVKMKYNAKFWKAFTPINNIPMDASVISDLIKTAPLETQFVESGK